MYNFYAIWIFVKISRKKETTLLNIMENKKYEQCKGGEGAKWDVYGVGLGLSSRPWEGEGRCQSSCLGWISWSRWLPQSSARPLCPTMCFNWSGAYIIKVIKYYPMSYSCCEHTLGWYIYSCSSVWLDNCAGEWLHHCVQHCSNESCGPWSGKYSRGLWDGWRWRGCVYIRSSVVVPS